MVMSVNQPPQSDPYSTMDTDKNHYYTSVVYMEVERFHWNAGHAEGRIPLDLKSCRNTHS